MTSNIEVKHFTINGLEVKLMFNPARAISTLAVLDPATIAKRPCFLCPENRPAGQKSIPFTATSGAKYIILENPYPIFRQHFTIPSVEHTPQNIQGRLRDMLEIADAHPIMTVLFNGPTSGATAPDHFHFQMGEKGFLPLQAQFHTLPKSRILQTASAKISLLTRYIHGLPVIEGEQPEDIVSAFDRILCKDHNLLCWKDGPTYRLVVFPRKKHRPDCYFAEGDAQVRISPGTVDMAGVFIAATRSDFDKVTAPILEDILQQVTDTRWQPTVEVGLMQADRIQADFLQPHSCGTESPVSGKEIFSICNGKVQWNGTAYSSLEFKPVKGHADNPGFVLEDVTIGVDFHWERKESQRFTGSLKILPLKDRLLAINVIGVEDYLLSVISSEMNSSAPEEFLKAHAVISRSWLLARPTLAGKADAAPSAAATASPTDSSTEYIKWYDREDHTLFDVCADDHCQRYQGLGRAQGESVCRAIDRTWGQVLTADGSICDTRFSKCCGGMTEKFSTCWRDDEPGYLTPVRDTAAPDGDDIPDLTREDEARKWILDKPEAFCNTADSALLHTVLNSYDCETADFYRWEVSYSQEDLSDLLRRKSGIDFGHIVALVPLSRGASGRIYRLEIQGTKRTVTVGKELEIRRWLSESHLYSSAFIVETDGSVTAETGLTLPGEFTLKGAGWGHGVGLCQIGAAAMSARGYTYDRILYHYYKGSQLKKLY